ncbi:MAG: histidine phosphatase family protein [Clostridia bacterium]|nr:histidine phosphatase family protein [Clostridia bacterium]
MKILIIRHAEPDYSIDSLTPKGWREAELLSKRLLSMPPADGYYCSPLGRAIDTSRPTMEQLNIQPTILPWLKEFRATITDPESGEQRIPWDLKPHLWRDDPALLNNETWLEHPLMNSGDTNVAEVFHETCLGLDRLLADHGYIKEGSMYRCNNNREGYLVLFCHMALALAVIGYLTNISPFLLWHGFCLPPSSVTTLVTEERTPGLVSFRCFQAGDTSHLALGNEPPSRMAMFQEVYRGSDHTRTT